MMEAEKTGKREQTQLIGRDQALRRYHVIRVGVGMRWRPLANGMFGHLVSVVLFDQEGDGDHIHQPTDAKEAESEEIGETPAEVL
jgi:hypothetical protein